jgi:hypothetical protein
MYIIVFYTIRIALYIMRLAIGIASDDHAIMFMYIVFTLFACIQDGLVVKGMGLKMDESSLTGGHVS